jgi:hypothetical protein
MAKAVQVSILSIGLLRADILVQSILVWITSRHSVFAFQRINLFFHRISLFFQRINLFFFSGLGPENGLSRFVRSVSSGRLLLLGQDFQPGLGVLDHVLD